MRHSLTLWRNVGRSVLKTATKISRRCYRRYFVIVVDEVVDRYRNPRELFSQMFINFVKNQQESVQDTVSDAGNARPSSAACDDGNFRQSLDDDDDEALIDISEDETIAGQWFSGLQVSLSIFV